MIEVQSGEGGDDSKAFANELWSAYLAYAARNQLCPELSEEGPSKWSFTIRDRRAIDLFQDEAGGHCIQRVPPNERAGRRHTSYVTVVVTPLKTQKVVTLKECDLEETFQRFGGKGGQNQNKVCSGVRLRHKPTGIEVTISGRDQGQNRMTARSCLEAKLVQWSKSQQTRAAYSGAGRGDKIRTYNMIDNRIVDHRNGVKCHRPEMVLDEGRFELLK